MARMTDILVADARQDGRILGLTPAQYLVVVWTALGIWLLATALRRPEPAPSGEGDSAEQVAPTP